MKAPSLPTPWWVPMNARSFHYRLRSAGRSPRTYSSRSVICLLKVRPTFSISKWCPPCSRKPDTSVSGRTSQLRQPAARIRL